MQGEVKTIGETGGVGDGVGQVGELFRHEATGANLAFGVGGEETPGAVERGVMSQTREYIRDGASGAVSVGDAAGSEQREFLIGGEVAEEAHGAFFAPDVVTLDFDVESVGTEDALEVIEGRGDGVIAAGLPS